MEQCEHVMQFIEHCRQDPCVRSRLNSISTIEELHTELRAIGSPLASSLIPMEQATRPPKILIDSGQLEHQLSWRILKCQGGPVVLQMICKNVNFAVWMQRC